MLLFYMGVGKSYATLHFCHHQKPRQKSSHMTRQYALPTMEQDKRILRKKKFAKSKKKMTISLFDFSVMLIFFKPLKKYRKIAKLRFYVFYFALVLEVKKYCKRSLKKICTFCLDRLSKKSALMALIT